MSKQKVYDVDELVGEVVALAAQHNCTPQQAVAMLQTQTTGHERNVWRATAMVIATSQAEAQQR